LLIKNQQLFYVHIPKCGGTSFKNILYSFFDESEICPLWAEWLLFDEKGSLEKYRFYHGHFDFDLRERFNKKPIVVTFLRNPKERVLSQYYYSRNLPEADVIASTGEARYVIEKMKELDLVPLLELQDPLVDRYLFNLQTRQIAKGAKYGIDYEVHAQNDLLQLALKNLIDIDFIGITEYFEKSIRLFDSIFKTVNKTEILELNKTKRSSVSDIDDYRIDKAIQRCTNLDNQLYKTGVVILNAELAKVADNQKYSFEYVDVIMGNGFYPMETDQTNMWNWSLPFCKLSIYNNSGSKKRIAFSFLVKIPMGDDNEINVIHEDDSYDFIISGRELVSIELDLKEGSNLLYFSCKKTIKALNDSRSISMGLFNISVEMINK
jgi:hypothetical protein